MGTPAPLKAAPTASARPAAPASRRPLTRSASPATKSTAPPAVRLFDKDVIPPGMFRTGDGKLVELPPDVTYEEATRLEAEAKAAQARLGKGPPPKPVPDVKTLVKKEEKKATLKPPPKGKKSARGRGKGSRRRAGGSPVLKGFGSGKVAQYLAAKAAPVLMRGFSKLIKLRENEQTHDDAPEKRRQTESAVVIPLSEGQSKSNTGQVTAVGDRPAPLVDENKGKQTLQEKLVEHAPRTIEDVDNFKSNNKAQLMGADVMGVVLKDKNAVVSTYEEMNRTPAPAPREHEPENLPPQEVAPGTANMNLGQGAIAPLQKEHTDVSKFTSEADSKLKEEGVTQEQLDMVDSGDLAKANQEKKGLEKAAKTEPLAVQKFAQEETVKVDRDLKQEENKERSAMKAKRKADLGATAQKQKKGKSDLEKKREEVANKINGIFTAAQDKVKKRLADLETQSMKRFDDGNASATKEFEENVNREIAAFKSDRYSGWFGWARRAKDWVLGIADLPEVEAIFNRNRSKFVNTINKLVEDISADNKRVIQECKDELTKARAEIKVFVDGLKPSLQGIGKQAAEEMNSKLDAMDQFIAKKEEDLQNKLKDKQTAAIKAIDEKIEKMKEAMAGALAKLGKLLLLAAKKFFSWALEKFGFSLSEIESIINKGVAVLKAIFTKPIQFVKNLIKAATTGFKNFAKNFLTHLKNAVFEWLTGSLENIQLPSTWDLKGILGVIFQMVGLTYANIRAHLVKYIPEPVVKGLETTFELVKTLIKEGPMAAWEQLKQIGADMQEAFINAVKDWIKWKIVEKAVETVLSIFVPGAGIIRAIVAIYDTIVFFIQKAKDIMKMIGNFLGSIAEIAAGNIGAAATALEEGLARGLVLVIDFLARFLRLSGITKKIRDVLHTIKGKVDAVLDKVAKWIVGKAKHLIGKGVTAVKAGVSAVLQWWKVKLKFKAGGEMHTAYFAGEGKAARLMIASDDAKTLDELVAERRASAPKLTDRQDGFLSRAIAEGRNLREYTQTTAATQTSRGGTEYTTTRTLEIKEEIDRRLQVITKLLKDGDGLPEGFVPSKVTYTMASGKARRVVADPLTKVEGNTRGEPTGSGGPKIKAEEIVERVNRTTPSRSGKTSARDWRKVHLLTGAMHGPFTGWNVAWGRAAVNSSFLTNAENFLKNNKDKYIFKYDVRVNYHGSGKDIEEKVDDKIVARAPATDFPQSFTISLQFKEATKNAPFRDHLSNYPIPASPIPYRDPSDIAAQKATLKTVHISNMKANILRYIKARKEHKDAKGTAYTWARYLSSNIDKEINKEFFDDSDRTVLRSFYVAECEKNGLTLMSSEAMEAKNIPTVSF